MAMLVLVNHNKNIMRHKVITTIEAEERKEALERFNLYKEDGVIQNQFEEDTWRLSDEKDFVSLHFTFDEVFVKKHMNYYSIENFKDVLKYYICFCLGQYTIGCLQEILHHIKELLYNTECLTKIPQKKRYLLNKTGILDFIELMPFSNEDIILEEEKYKYDHVKRRDLAEYQSYFLFGKLLDNFWKNKATEHEKTLFYPIYLWWNITMILPLRVTEFTLIPKKCLTKKNGSYYLKIRRTKIKGSSKKSVTYKIDEDYKIYEYAISNEIAEMILEYKGLIKNYKESNIDSLFINEIYESKKTINCGFFHVRHFSRLLDLFYCDVVEKYYNYEVIQKSKLKITSFDGEAYKLKHNKIVRISLGDSRHIAMQNMLLNGCNILMAKEITGHESANMIFHYSGNMKNLIKCKAYSLFEMSKRKEIVINSLVNNNKNFNILGEEIINFVEVDEGNCFSPLFTQGQLQDCYAVAGKCETCNYLKCNKSRNELIERQEAEVEKRIERLKNWIYSEKEYRNTDEYKVLTSQLQACVENLLDAYIEEMKEENRYD